MNTSIYHINKGVNAPISFKGLKGQYISYLAVTLVTLLICFAILYIAGLNRWICLIAVFSLGTAGVWFIYHLNHLYGIYGLMKRNAHSALPNCLSVKSLNTISCNLSTQS